MSRPADHRHPDHLVVGHLTKAHGTKGEFFVRSLTEYPQTTFVPGVEFMLGARGGDAPDPDLPRLRVAAVRPVPGGFLVAFEGISTRSEAEVFRGTYVYRRTEDLEPLAEGEWFQHHLEGMEVVTADGGTLGRVVAVYELEPADLLEIRGPEKEYLVPFREGIVVSVDRDTRCVTIDPPEGLLDL